MSTEKNANNNKQILLYELNAEMNKNNNLENISFLNQKENLNR
jgi:hypothetical protein